MYLLYDGVWHGWQSYIGEEEDLSGNILAEYLCII